MSSPKYPNVLVHLSGEDGNAFFILGRTVKAMRKAKVTEEEIDSFLAEAKAGDYDHLLQTVMAWVNWD